MKKIPSFGFVYLVFITLITLWFSIWIVSEGWYDRIYTLFQTNKDFRKWARYLENVADNSKSISDQEKVLHEAGSLYIRIGDKKDAAGVYRRLTKSFPDNMAYLSQLNSLLYASTKDRAEAMTNAQKLYRNGYIDENILKMLLYQSFEGDDEVKKDELIELIFSGKYKPLCTFAENPDIALCNLTPDRWSINMEPFFIAARNSQDETMQIKLELCCWPRSKFTSIVAEIKGVDFEKRVVFNRKNRFRTITLTIPPREAALFKGTTNKTWRAPRDPRKLGVNVHSIEVIKAATTSIADEHLSEASTQ